MQALYLLSALLAISTFGAQTLARPLFIWPRGPARLRMESACVCAGARARARERESERAATEQRQRAGRGQRRMPVPADRPPGLTFGALLRDGLRRDDSLAVAGAAGVAALLPPHRCGLPHPTRRHRLPACRPRARGALCHAPERGGRRRAHARGGARNGLRHRRLRLQARCVDRRGWRGVAWRGKHQQEAREKERRPPARPPARVCLCLRARGGSGECTGLGGMIGASQLERAAPCCAMLHHAGPYTCPPSPLIVCTLPRNAIRPGHGRLQHEQDLARHGWSVLGAPPATSPLLVMPCI